MKPRLKILGMGAALGAVLLLAFWLLGDVAHFINVGWQDSSFFIGLIAFLLGLLMIVRGGKSSKYTVAMGARSSHIMQAAINPSLANEKEPRQSRDANEIRKAPLICMGAGILNLLIYGISFLFIR